LGLGSESLVVSDPKGQVTIKLNPSPNSVSDALEVDGTYLRKKISERRRKGVKAFLIDQSTLRGIGNPYVEMKYFGRQKFLQSPLWVRSLITSLMIWRPLYEVC
jgi:hypothetical protein